jgi:hypothetical protein
MIDEGDCGAIGGMKIGRGNRSTRRKPAPAPFCPPQIPFDHSQKLVLFITTAVRISNRTYYNGRLQNEQGNVMECMLVMSEKTGIIQICKVSASI